VHSIIEIEVEQCANVYNSAAYVALIGQATLMKTVVSGEFLDLDIDREDVGDYLEAKCY
jgi:hypothetical protein